MKILFKDAVSSYITALAETRCDGNLSPNTIRIYKLRANRLNLYFGDYDLADVRNGKVKAYVAGLRALELSSSSIVGIIATLKQIIASQTNEDGDLLCTQVLKSKFIALPRVESKDQRCATAAEIEKAAFPIVAFLAASGLRISEALALCVNGAADCDSFDPATGTIKIRKTLKTRSSRRDVFLSEAFRTYFLQYVPASGRLFPTLTYQKLRGYLIAAALPPCHSYRRYRVSWLRSKRCQEDILRAQIGHSKDSQTDHYSYQDAAFARSEIDRCGEGFQLEGLQIQEAV